MGTFQTMSLQLILEIMDAWVAWELWLKVDSDAHKILALSICPQQPG